MFKFSNVHEPILFSLPTKCQEIGLIFFDPPQR
jgi:hypothetical protein